MHNLQETLDNWRHKLPDLEVIKPVKSGKEASVFLATTKHIKDSNEEYYALKIYKENHTKSTNTQYLAGNHYDGRVSRAMANKSKFGKSFVEQSWTQREFTLMRQLKEAGARVPKVYEAIDNSIIMEYLGNFDTPAPRLQNVELTYADALRFYNQIIDSMELFMDNGIVHGDLSEHNILWWDNEIYIIDFPQAVDIKRNPNAQKILERDLYNVNKFFGRWLNQEKLITL